MILKQIEFESKEYKQMLELRNEVLRKPIHWPLFVFGETENEVSYFHFGGFDEKTNALLTCCILVHYSGVEVQLKQMAASPNIQGKGLGLELLKHVEKFAIAKRYLRLFMHARKTAVGFYQKNGYKVVGEEFEEVGLPHFKMEKNLGG
jgi:predicted GNAT family N-acyltransferase